MPYRDGRDIPHRDERSELRGPSDPRTLGSRDLYALGAETPPTNYRDLIGRSQVVEYRSRFDYNNVPTSEPPFGRRWEEEQGPPREPRAERGWGWEQTPPEEKRRPTHRAGRKVQAKRRRRLEEERERDLARKRSEGRGEKRKRSEEPRKQSEERERDLARARSEKRKRSEEPQERKGRNDEREKTPLQEQIERQINAQRLEWENEQKRRAEQRKVRLVDSMMDMRGLSKTSWNSMSKDQQKEVIDIIVQTHLSVSRMEQTASGQENVHGTQQS